MSLIKSISGIRGTIGGLPGVSLSPLDIVRFTAAYAQLIRESNPGPSYTVVVGRDARISGDMVRQLVCGTLRSCGMHVTDIGLASTPTT
ncbi:MAG TPA: phosphoglucosamine mutase, partial [Bacteroidales bacterium]|nr:phosphoglucosamine mutase [Bacteroidales bacterium]